MWISCVSRREGCQSSCSFVGLFTPREAHVVRARRHGERGLLQAPIDHLAHLFTSVDADLVIFLTCRLLREHLLAVDEQM